MSVARHGLTPASVNHITDMAVSKRASRMESDFYYEDEAGGSAPCSLRETALYCIGRTIHEKRRIPPLATPLPAELANSLISCMRHRRLLNSDTISLFDNRFTVTEVRVSNILGVLKLRSLSTLIVSESQSFGDCELKMICEFMPRLSVIDFSTNRSTIIFPLTKLQNLKVLVMHRVSLSHAAGIDPESGIRANSAVA
uniref:Uncharacterized protein n=1 Tax=Parascaris univalens TaxID=6257 RepID=A0A915CGP0_PARUN